MPRENVMLCYQFDQRRLDRMNKPWLVQPKINGRRCRWDAEAKKLFSSEGNAVNSVPLIKEALKDCYRDLDGELFSPNVTTEEIHSIVSTKIGLHPNHSEISFYVFDIIDEYIPQQIRLDSLHYLFSNHLPECHWLTEVPVYQAHNLHELHGIYTSIISHGYEGIIIRDPQRCYEKKRSTAIMKLKPMQEDIFAIIDSIEEYTITGEPKNALGALVCLTSEGEPFNVGTGFTREQREDLWIKRRALPNARCKVRYQNLTADRQVPLFPSFRGLV